MATQSPPVMPQFTDSSDGAVDSRPPPKDLSHHLSRATKSRAASSMKAFYKYFAIPGIGQLAGGLPNNYYFPFDTLEAKVAEPERWKPTPNEPIDPPPAHELLSALSVSEKDGKAKPTSSPLNQPQSQIAVPHTSHQPNPIRKIDLSSALQYGTAQGYPPLYYFIRQFTQDHLHPNCPYKAGPEVILTCGNTDGFSKVLTAFTNEWSEEKDWVRDREGLLCEEFAYMNAVQAAKPRGMNVAPVKMDDEGMLATGKGGLKDVLENWDFKTGRRPHLMYTVTMGQNPTSGVLSLARRREIYALCSKYDVIIVEDDPYWYLQFPSSTALNADRVGPLSRSSTSPKAAMSPPADASVTLLTTGEPRPASWKSSGFPFLDSLVPSFISIDTDGRVIRLDTFSKTVAPGCRLGWISAQPDIVERILRITETSTQQPSGFVQSIIAETLLGPDHSGIETTKKSSSALPDGAGWKMPGWVRWLEGLRGNYERRMQTMCSILDDNKYLLKTGRRNSIATDEVDADEWSVVTKTPVYDFIFPVGGMFIWLNINFPAHPLYKTYAAQPGGLARLSRAMWIFWTQKPYLVLVSPGTIFSPTAEIAASDGWKYFRLCFAAINEGELAPTSHRLAEGVQGFFKVKKVEDIEKLLEEDGVALEERIEDGGLGRLVGFC
ncbi:hypothetical protein LTR95_010481 [Oleoguttula sp. CCFEE 5521]